MTDEFVVRADRVVKSYGPKKALDGASVGIVPGQIHVLLGRNGSGKTTLAKILAGILIPDSGHVSTEIADSIDASSFRRQVGFLFDSSAHWESLTGRENAWFYARSFGLSPEEAGARLDRLFKHMALEGVADDLVATYSFGMRRKLAVVEALAHDPKIIVMDEPSMGLDFASRTKLYSILQARAAEGKAVLVATNDMNEARHLADTVSLMDEGRILASGAPEELVRGLNGAAMIRVELKVPTSLENLRRLPGVLGVSAMERNGTITLEVMTSTAQEEQVLDELVRTLASSGVGIGRIELRRPELGDVFLKYAGGETDAPR